MLKRKRRKRLISRKRSWKEKSDYWTGLMSVNAPLHTKVTLDHFIKRNAMTFSYSSRSYGLLNSYALTL